MRIVYVALIIKAGTPGVYEVVDLTHTQSWFTFLIFCAECSYELISFAFVLLNTAHLSWFIVDAAY